ncbi:GIY-YIG nuclease family protein [Myxosarcina sp. GI1]|uniref:GIY-YIG nuclease family protein n=1 Tax=Myxosarcina sp. GI1 TaxID=1541065 RepID=UPI000907A0BA|nr:GIY-YIG nuclease family protein [Myxosarcina sp. GI1]
MNRNEWKTWNKVLLRNKELLPDYSGIYIVADETDFVLYVGKSKDIKSRWIGHHRHKQLIRRDNKNRRFYIYFNYFVAEKLDEKERYYIELLEPSLNSTKITKYIPKIPTSESVLTKLLRTINKKTSLFPNVRSLILGYWYDREPDDSYCHVAIAVGLNDLEGSVVNSACVKTKNKYIRGSLKKNSNWRYYQTYCGLSENEHHPTAILTYYYQKFVIHFVWIGWEVVDWANANQSELSKISFYGIETYCLNSHGILKTLKLERYNDDI